MRPGQRNSLDALCRAYDVDNSARELHGALLDAEILADVYLMMTGGQTALNLASHGKDNQGGSQKVEHQRVTNRPALKVLRATADEEALHQERLARVKEEGGHCLWQDS